MLNNAYCKLTYNRDKTLSKFTLVWKLNVSYVVSLIYLVLMNTIIELRIHLLKQIKF